MDTVKQTADPRSDVSRRALSVARMIDRLEPGCYTITLKRPESDTEGWVVEISQAVVVQRKEITSRQSDQAGST